MTHLSSPDIHSVSFTQVTDARGEGRFTMGNDLFIADSVDAKELSEAPVQLGFLLLSLCTSGEIELNLGESRHHIRQGDLFIALGVTMLNVLPQQWMCWAVFAGFCLISMGVMLGMVKWLERVTK